jgi:hypothetical protein
LAHTVRWEPSGKIQGRSIGPSGRPKRQKSKPTSERGNSAKNQKRSCEAAVDATAARSVKQTRYDHERKRTLSTRSFSRQAVHESQVRRHTMACTREETRSAHCKLDPSLTTGRTRIRLQLAIYFCLHKGKCRLKGCRMASPNGSESEMGSTPYLSFNDSIWCPVGNFRAADFKF